MIKTFLYSKSKIYILALIILMFLFSQNSYAVGKKVTSFKPVDVLITKQQFIFKEAYGSVEDDFEDIYEEVYAFIVQNGAVSTKKAILYLDYGTVKTNPNMFKSNIQLDVPIINYLENTYGQATLKSYRRVLVGYLIAPQYFIAAQDGFGEYIFEAEKEKAIQSMDNTAKTPISAVYNNNPVNNETNSEENKYGNYSKSHKLLDKISMFNFVNLDIANNKYVGVMEIYDKRLDIYTFLTITGNQEAFIEAAGLSPSLEMGKFKKRSDVEITEDKQENELLQ